MNGDGHGLESQRILDTDWTAGKVKASANESTSPVPSSDRGHRWKKALDGWVKDTLKGWVKQELAALLKLVFPIYLTLFLTQSIFLVSLIFVGHITGKALEIDAAGLAIAVINMTGFSVIHGLSTAVDTLCSQAFGHQAYKRIGIVLQQAVFILGLCVFPVLAMWLNMETLLTLLNQDPCVVRLTAQYVRIFCTALPFVVLLVVVSKYLQAQSIIVVFIAVGFVTNVLNITLHAIFLYGFDLGFEGAVYAMTLSQSAAPLFLLAAMWAWGLHKQTWGGWSWESLVDWWTFTKLAIPGLLMVGFEWWSNEVGIIVVGMIGKKELAVYTIALNVTAFLFMNALSISFATSIRVGNELGAGNTQRAKRVFYIALMLTVCEALVLAVGLQGLKYQLGGMFTYDETVIKGVAKLMNVVPFFVFFDHIQGTLAGVLRGCGRQILGAVSNFVCFYIIGLPIGVCLALVAEMGAIGFWIGLLCGSTIQSVVFFVVLMTMDWEKQSKTAIEKAGRQVSIMFINVGSEDQRTTQGECIPLQRTAEGHTASLLNKGRRRSGCSKCFRRLSSSKTRLVLYRGSFYLVASIILIAGGIGSHFKLPLAEGNTTNTTSCGERSMLNTTVLFSSGLPDNGDATMASLLPPSSPPPSPLSRR
ncbi:hypothetical protein EMCRGX_G031804 [Ephydatia muelleri]|eukprot:Em0018g197a